MDSRNLKVGRAYFACGYFLRHSPIPDIEALVYLGSNIYEEDKESKTIFHYFEDPESYLWDKIVKEQPGDAEEHEKPKPNRLRVSEEDIEALIYDLTELEGFVNALRKEPNANETF